MIRLYILKSWFLIFAFFPLFLYSQQLKPVARQVDSYHALKMTFVQYDLFERNPRSPRGEDYRKAAADLTVLRLHPESLKKMLQEKPDFIEFSFPFKTDSTVTLELYRYQPFSAGFRLILDGSETLPYTSGLYYRGIIKGNNRSVAAFSFFRDQVMGVASSPEQGNIILGKTGNSSDFVSYSEGTLTGKNPFTCATDELPVNRLPKILTENAAGAPSDKADKCVAIYYEVCYKPYQNNGSDPYATGDWLSGIHNNIATLFANDGIRISLNEINIWTSPDPYTGTPAGNLDAFRNNRTYFNGQLGVLINSPSSSSIAYLGSLCTPFHHAYAAVDQTYNQVPVYSWSISAATHEMGHSFGSPHTHACVWNGDNTPIDGCGPAAGYSEGCTGPLPSAGGTIMSYCHLLSVGTNLSLGFGPQPAALMKSNINGAICLGTNCNTACLSTTTFAPNIASLSGNIDSCTTWGNPASILRNTQDIKTINPGITVTANENWSTQAIRLNTGSAVQFSGSKLIDFVNDQGADKPCGCP
ncbi:M12 family metallo-peptidase [uncultured Chryseobacterium sp.]|uniref:M12 family metallo-peptidase n=1 Tax=uncultured Chryseobacterium sp. TaxID=259322 RepID=UPI0025D11A87|nr:M12 family metallo-peptidase [uncultured Chryseobacterium sp.]